jgi:hypothetical protein
VKSLKLSPFEGRLYHFRDKETFSGCFRRSFGRFEALLTGDESIRQRRSNLIFCAGVFTPRHQPPFNLGWPYRFNKKLIRLHGSFNQRYQEKLLNPLANYSGGSSRLASSASIRLELGFLGLIYLFNSRFCRASC